MKIINPLIFATSIYDYLKKEIANLSEIEIGETEKNDFPDGEHYQRIITNPEDRDIIIIGGTISDADTLEIFDLACALVKYGARTLTIVIPYFGYSTMERAVKDGEIVKAKTRARLFSAIPSASVGNKIIMIDLHSEGISHYFEGSVRTTHLYAKDLILEAILELAEGKEFVLASTDAGRAKWVQSLANEIGVTPAFVFKKRLSGEETEITAVSAQVKDKNVIIYDDMIRTGGSLLGAAKAYKSNGAADISVVTTHGVFPGSALDKLKDSKIINKIICTNTHPQAKKLAGDFLQVKSVASIICKALGEQR